MMRRMDEMLRLSLLELVEALRTRRVSPVELMDAVLDRVEATHPALNARAS